MIEGKLSKNEETKDEDAVPKPHGSPIQFADALRLPNISLKGTAENI